MTGVNDILLASAALYGPAPAVVAGDIVLTYIDLHETVVRYAQRMRAAGLGRGSVVAVRIDRSADTLPIFLATQWIGATYLPIDERQPPARFRYMIQDARCDGLIVEDGIDVGDQDPGLRIILRRSQLSEPSTVDGAPESGDGAYILYTSGSTGLPKAVPISSANLSVLTDWLRTAYTPAEMACYAFTISVAFDVSFAEMLGPLMHGGTLVVFEDLYAIGATDQPITALTNTPSNLARNLEHWPLPQSLLVVTAAGEPLRADLSQRILATVPRLLNGYGPTEATVYTTVHEVRPEDLDRTAIPIGQPLDGVVLTVRREDGTLCDDGEPGELYISGPSVSAGYLSAAGRNEAFFHEHGAAYPTYRSGDIVVRHPDGLFDCLGRRDRQCKINGIRVDPAGGDHLAPALRGRGERARVHAGDSGWSGAGGLRHRPAWRKPRPGQDSRRARRTVLARYAVPQDVVVVGELPFTLSGKVDDDALLARLEATSAQDPVTALVELCLAPATGDGDESPLAAMTSLELIDFRRRMLQEHGIDLPLQLIYRCRDLTELAKLVRSRRDGVAALAAPAAPQECGIGEQNIWLADMVDPEACANNEVYRLTFAQPVDRARIEAALRQCVLDLPALRTAYRYSRGRLFKEIADPGAALGAAGPAGHRRRSQALRPGRAAEDPGLPGGWRPPRGAADHPPHRDRRRSDRRAAGALRRRARRPPGRATGSTDRAKLDGGRRPGAAAALLAGKACGAAVRRAEARRRGGRSHPADGRARRRRAGPAASAGRFGPHHTFRHSARGLDHGAGPGAGLACGFARYTDDLAFGRRPPGWAAEQHGSAGRRPTRLRRTCCVLFGPTAAGTAGDH